MSCRAGWLIGALGVMLAAGRAEATLVAHEGFDYGPAGADLSGANGGAGFGGAWRAGGFNATISANFDLANQPISFGPLLHSPPSVSTSAVNAISGLTRNLATPLGQAGTTAYISFLVQPTGTLHGGVFNGFFGLVLESAAEPELFIGKAGGGAISRWVLEDRGGALQHASPPGVGPTVGETALLVVKAEFTAGGNDRFTLYVNPTPGAAEPAAGIVKQDANVGIVAGLTLYSTGAVIFDELRVGDTFADVTPVPEPIGLAVAAAAMAAIGGFRSRARRRMSRTRRRQ